MKLVRDAIIILLIALIKIGDGVIGLVHLILRLCSSVAKAPFSLARELKKRVHRQQIIVDSRTVHRRLQVKPPSHLIYRYKRPLLPKIRFRFPLFLSRQKSASGHAHRVQKENRKATGSILFSFFSKIKYFSLGASFSFFFLFVPLLFYLFVQSLPNPRELSLRLVPQTTKIYDRNGKLLYQIYATQNRTIVPLNTIPLYLQQATIAIEDKDFYTHPGFDIAAIARSVLKNYSSGKELQGGSTITQQLIKSALLTPETTLSRKAKELILAFWAERIYSKQQILEMYFNQVPYGGTAWGVEAASEVYFGKNIKDLDLAESSFLAGIPQAPTIYSPFGNSPDAWKKRQLEVLRRMTDLGYISQKQANEAVEENLVFQQPRIPIHAPHFVLYVKDLLIKKYGLPVVEKGGLTVITSLDLKIQEQAEQIVSDEVNADAYLNLTNGAALITNPKNGDILAMVGSKDYYDQKGGNVNLTNSLRQPGSSIKVVTYSAGLSSGLTAASIIDDSPTTYSFPGGTAYSPVNYDGKFHGRVSLRIALANSFNIPAVKVLNQIGIPTMVQFGKQMGIRTWLDPSAYGLSITLGAAEVTMLDMATVYGTLANTGARVDINPLIRVSDYQNNVLEEKTAVQPKRVLDEGVAFIVSDILTDNNARAFEFGINSPLAISGVSVKTGTTDEKRDNWTIGYTPNVLVATWVGNNDNSPMSQNLASGITGAAPIWNKLMTIMLPLTGGGIRQKQPTNVVQKQCLGRNEYFVKGTENTVSCAPPITPTPTKTP